MMIMTKDKLMVLKEESEAEEQGDVVKNGGYS